MKLSTYSYRFTAPHPPAAQQAPAPDLAENSDTGEMDEPHFFPMVAQQYMSPGPSTSDDDDDDDNDSGIGTLADNSVSPRRLRSTVGSDPMEPGFDELSMGEEDAAIIRAMHCKRPLAIEDEPSPPARRWRVQCPPMEPDLEMERPKRSEPEAPKTPVKRSPGGKMHTVPRRKVLKSPKRPKRLSVIHEVVGGDSPEEEYREPRHKPLVKRLPGLSKYELLRVKAERRIKRWTHGSPQHGAVSAV